ncbi:hypothetical protein CPB83DRAFT_859558 [Crepidotus variabilis]|uniref:Glycosyltransferase 61 catalytic domain-containing protein n=1 Tax=Crepidotus variabilis TaxID=179855 RepID=A0A9P6JLR4_9AGAR|nr:hypothetical protein CPB83DRAFT_859558 [Crepidotus variabilis]
MPALPRRYIVVVFLLIFGVLFLTRSSPHARERASSPIEEDDLSWLSSPGKDDAPNLNVQPGRSSNHNPFHERPSSNLFPGSPSLLHPETTITESSLPLQEAGVAHVPGFTYFERLYVWNGTIYAVMSEEKQEKFPKLLHVISKGKDKGTGENIDPTDAEMQIITPDEAKRVLGSRAAVIEGTSFILYDTKQFMAHYYHWWGEIILGTMRIYSSVSLLLNSAHSATSQGSLYMPDPDRFILPNVLDQGWRDHAGVNGPLMRAAFPSAAIERRDLWNDLIQIEQPFVLEKGMIISRVAAHKSPLSAQWAKMIGSTMAATPATRFWEPVRQRVVNNMIGYVPIQNDAGKVVKPISAPSHSSGNPAKPDTSTFGSSRPLVIYVSRQNHGRKLTNEANESLESSMRGVCETEGLCEFQVAHMEDWPFKDQIEGVSRAVIMIGVHGNGLTHQIWMPPSSRSTVIEITYPETYLHDYSMLARNVGHKHYAIWNDTSLTFEEGKTFDGVEGGTRETFHGDAIPVHGPTVADIVRQRLTETSH